MEPTPRIDAILACPRRFWGAQCRVTLTHMRTLMDRGIPARDLVRNGMFTFGVIMLAGVEMIVTEDSRLRSYMSGYGYWRLPGG